MEQIKQIVDLTKQNFVRPEIARQVGVSTWTVFKYQKAFGLM